MKDKKQYNEFFEKSERIIKEYDEAYRELERTKVEKVKIFIEYKGFRVELKKEEGFYEGQLIKTNDLFYFSGITVESAIEDFKETVELYMILETKE